MILLMQTAVKLSIKILQQFFPVFEIIAGKKRYHIIKKIHIWEFCVICWCAGL